MNDKAPDIIEDLSMVTPHDDWWWVRPAIVIAIILFAAGLFFWRFYRKKKHLTQNTPAIPAHITARERLVAIRPLITEGRFREFVIEVSRILRFYIEGRFTLRAPHLSTEEFLYEAEQNEALNPSYRELLADFLFQCDLVKFALGGTNLDQVENLYRTAENFINQTALPTNTPAGTRASS